MLLNKFHMSRKHCANYFVWWLISVISCLRYFAPKGNSQIIKFVIPPGTLIRQYEILKGEGTKKLHLFSVFMSAGRNLRPLFDVFSCPRVEICHACALYFVLSCLRPLVEITIIMHVFVISLLPFGAK